MRLQTRVDHGFGDVAAAFVANRWPEEWRGLSYQARLLVWGLRTVCVREPPVVSITTVGWRGQDYARVCGIADRLEIPRTLLAVACLVNTLEAARLTRTAAVLSLDMSCVDSGLVLDVLQLYGTSPGAIQPDLRQNSIAANCAASTTFAGRRI